MRKCVKKSKKCSRWMKVLFEELKESFVFVSKMLVLIPSTIYAARVLRKNYDKLRSYFTKRKCILNLFSKHLNKFMKTKQT